MNPEAWKKVKVSILLFVMLFAIGTNSSSAQEAYLVKDMNAIGQGSDSRALASHNGIFYFRAISIDGYGLWKSDGTEGGTTLVKDIVATGTAAFINDDFFFYAGYRDGGGGGLWKSDGSEAGTVLVKPVNGVQVFAAIGGDFIFIANPQLWKSDGTEAGTVLILDAEPRSPVVVKNTLFFFMANNNYEKGLWKSDGTVAGTVLVKQLDDGFYFNASQAVHVDSILFFTTAPYDDGMELWKSDGTEAGTVLVKDIFPGRDSSFPKGLTNLNGTLIFSAYNDSTGLELWKSDGTEAGTELVKDISPGSGSSGPEILTSIGGTVFFSASDSTHGRELWKSDGTEEGTVFVKDVNAGSESSIRYFYPSNPNNWARNVESNLFFLADDGKTGNGLWKSDGTEAGTVLVKEINSGEGPTFIYHLLASVGGELFFSADDGLHGLELWKSDGTSEGTAIVKDINLQTLNSRFRSLTNVDGTLYYAADDGVHGPELWKSNGTEAGTMLVKDIFQVGPYWEHAPTSLTNVSGTVFFAATSEASGDELWKSDGTEAGTQIVKDINPASYHVWLPRIFPRELTNVDGTLFFVATDSVHGPQVWKSDGTESGTEMFVEVDNTDSIYPILIDVNGTLFFSVENYVTNVSSLWKSNADKTGAELVKEITMDVALSAPKNLTNAGGKLFFSLEESFYGGELWVSDGTAAGTKPLKRFVDWASEPRYLTDVAGTLFFSADTDSTGRELWKSDGTAEGTVMIKDIAPGGAGSDPALLTNVNGVLFFLSGGGYELWKSDGTEAGTVPIITSANKMSNIGLLTNMNGTLFFAGQDLAHGSELWALNTVTSVKTVDALPTVYELSQSYPNPFNPSTTINYALPQKGHVTLKVFNVLGQEVAQLVDEVKEAGRFQVQWQPEGLSSGLYVYRLQVGTFVESKKLLFLK